MLIVHIKIPGQYNTVMTDMHINKDHWWWSDTERNMFVQYKLCICWQVWSPGSLVSIVSDYGLDDWGLIPDRGRGFFF
jgi:hypothetical protein